MPLTQYTSVGPGEGHLDKANSEEERGWRQRGRVNALPRRTRNVGHHVTEVTKLIFRSFPCPPFVSEPSVVGLSLSLSSVDVRCVRHGWRSLYSPKPSHVDR